MTLTIKHATITGAAADSTALVDGPAWDANHTLTGSVAASEVTSGAALTRVNDTNVTLTFAGSPTAALLAATSVTVGWSGALAAGRGGFGADVSASSGVPLFAAGVATFTGTSGAGNFARVDTPAFTTPIIGAATGTSVALTGASTIYNATAIPAGGTAGTGYKFSSTSNYGIFFGSGAPTLSAAQGSIYLRSDGTPYYNTNGSTGWTAIGAGGTPGGSSTQVQYNNAGAFGGISGATTDGTNLSVTTQTARDNSTKAASTAYVDAAAREKLSAARTYYVRTDGSDSNTGLVDSAGGAFLTIQKAIDTAVALDLSTYAVTIQIRNGTYTGAVTLKSYIGVGPISIVGDTTTPANVVISVTSANAVTANGVIGAWRMSGMKITTVTTGHCFSIVNGSSLTMNGNFSIGPSASGYDHFSLATYAKVAITSNYSIVGSAYEHALCSGGAYFDNNSVTVTITGTPTFTYFYRAVRLGNVTAYGVTYSGAITAGATRYSITVNSILETGGATTSVPGSVAGTTATGGQAV